MTTVAEPQAPTQDQPEVEQPQPRYAEGVDELSAKVLAARETVGRKALAEFAGQTQSCIWRWERSRVHPTEVDDLKELVRRIDAGELPQPEPKKGGKLDQLRAVVEAAAADKKVTKTQLIDELRSILA